MNLHNNEYRFNVAPTITAPRSQFLMHQNIRTTFNAGKLIPFYVDCDIMPGDTFKMSGTFVVRQSTPVHPTMDNSFLDIFFFFIPHRLVWEHWKEFWGENTTGAWTQQVTYTIPQIYINNAGNPNTFIKKGDALNYMGIPLISGSNNTGIGLNALPLRAYHETWNEWFRDENVCPPIYIYKGDANRTILHGAPTFGQYSTTGTTITPDCAPVYKYKDYFNSCLPEPQKGGNGAITVPLGTKAPVIGNGVQPILLTADPTTNIEMSMYSDSNGNAKLTKAVGAVGTAVNVQVPTDTNKYIGLSKDPLTSGIVADLSNAVAATINAQRYAFAAQRILEQQARTGTRYTEIIKGFFGVTSPDARQQRPEYLGGKRIPITMNQVAQTSSTDTTSPQGNVSAYSLTVESGHMFHKSFTEHGTLLGLLCVRQEHSYDQGIARQWSRKQILDFYHPQLAFLGEQAVLNKEIYCDGSSTDNQVFGYNERWAELRYKNNINTGAFSTQYAQSLDVWHYGDSYRSLPVLSNAWRKETEAYIDRTLTVTSAAEDQYLMDSRLEMVAVRSCPMWSIPGLMDHF